MKKLKKHWFRDLSFLGKIWHIIKVILALITVAIMFLGTLYVVLIIFGVWGYILKARDFILLDIFKTIIENI